MKVTFLGGGLGPDGKGTIGGDMIRDNLARFVSIEQVNSDREGSVAVIPTSEKSLLARKTRSADPKESILTTDGDVAIASMSEPYDEESDELAGRIKSMSQRSCLSPVLYSCKRVRSFASNRARRGCKTKNGGSNSQHRGF